MLSNVFYLLAFPREIQFFYCPSHTDGQFSVSVNDAWPKLIFPPQKYAKHEHFKKRSKEKIMIYRLSMSESRLSYPIFMHIEGLVKLSPARQLNSRPPLHALSNEIWLLLWQKKES